MQREISQFKSGFSLAAAATQLNICILVLIGINEQKLIRRCLSYTVRIFEHIIIRPAVYAFKHSKEKYVNIFFLKREKLLAMAAYYCSD